MKDIVDICSKVSESWLKNYSVVLFKTEKYSQLFLERFVKFLAQKTTIPIKKIDLDQDVSFVQMQLETSFLGQIYIYWFSDISQISSKKKRLEYLTFLKTYQGPHIVVGLISDDVLLNSTKVFVAEIQKKYTKEQIINCPLLYTHESSELNVYFLGKLYKYNKEYSLEQLLLLLEYAQVLGKNTELFLDSWIYKLSASDISLFYVSQLFFEKKRADFFKVWHEVRNLYSDQFWTVFFSDQLFKAFLYVKWQAKVPVDQKNITFGLPFSFLKQDWKLYQLTTLQKFHQKMYEIDLALKSGGLNYRLDLFFTQFFQ